MKILIFWLAVFGVIEARAGRTANHDLEAITPSVKEASPKKAAAKVEKAAPKKAPGKAAKPVAKAAGKAKPSLAKSKTKERVSKTASAAPQQKLARQPAMTPSTSKNNAAREAKVTPEAAPPPVVVFKKSESHKFAGLKLKGQLKKPDLTFIYKRKGLRAEQIVDIPENFNSEVLEGATEF